MALLRDAREFLKLRRTLRDLRDYRRTSSWLWLVWLQRYTDKTWGWPLLRLLQIWHLPFCTIGFSNWGSDFVCEILTQAGAIHLRPLVSDLAQLLFQLLYQGWEPCDSSCKPFGVFRSLVRSRSLGRDQSGDCIKTKLLRVGRVGVDDIVGLVVHDHEQSTVMLGHEALDLLHQGSLPVVEPSFASQIFHFFFCF